MEIDVVDIHEGETTGELELSDDVFDAEVREHLFWEVVNWQRAKRHQGTHKAKSRSEVSGGGRKPWAQKGTGRARHGSIRSPLWVGGGTSHGPNPRNYDYQISKKKRRAALRAALTGRLREETLHVVDDLELGEIKTQRAVEVLEDLGAPDALVIDTTDHDEASGEVVHNRELQLSVRNLPDVKYLAAEGLNVEDILNYDALVASREAIEQIQEELQP
jgi:large subunit ribosomal protein L4